VFIKFAALDTRFKRVDGPARQAIIEYQTLKFGPEGDYWIPVLQADFQQVAAAGYFPNYFVTQAATAQGSLAPVYDVLGV
jgi:hypothetical protein